MQQQICMRTINSVHRLPAAISKRGVVAAACLLAWETPCLDSKALYQGFEPGKGSDRSGQLATRAVSAAGGVYP
jgi:hypothetical protein